MKLCIDGIGSSHTSGTSLYSYTLNLLTEINTDKNFDQIFAIWDNFPLESDFLKMTNINFIPLSLNRTSNDYSELLNLFTSSNIDIYHSPNNGFSIPEKSNTKYISTIHTIYPLIDNEEIHNPFYKKFSSLIQSSIDNSDKIITTSNFTKNEIISNLKIDSTNLFVVMPNPNKIFKPQDQSRCLDIINNKYNLHNPFIFYCGSITKRKMIDKVLLLFSYIAKKEKNIDLVIAGDYTGKRDYYYRFLCKEIFRLGLQDNVYFLGIVDYYDMPIFYSSSLCVIDFSLYNDFPLSSIEAVNSGGLVICNKTPSNNELLENSVIFSSLDDFSTASDILSSFLHNPLLKQAILSYMKMPQIISNNTISDVYLNTIS